MRRRARAWLGIVFLGLLLCAGTLAAVTLAARLGFGGGERTLSSSVDFSALRQGRLSWDRTYESPLGKFELWHASPRLAWMQLEEGARSTNQCLWLSQQERWLVMGSTTAVRLCPIQGGTLMIVHQTFSWQR